MLYLDRISSSISKSDELYGTELGFVNANNCGKVLLAKLASTPESCLKIVPNFSKQMTG